MHQRILQMKICKPETNDNFWLGVGTLGGVDLRSVLNARLRDLQYSEYAYLKNKEVVPVEIIIEIQEIEKDENIFNNYKSFTEMDFSKSHKNIFQTRLEYN